MQHVPRLFVKARQWVFASKLHITATLVILLILIILIYRHATAKSSQVTYQTDTVQRGSVISTVTESGNVSTDSQTNVMSPTDGIITAVYVKNGDSVTSGENLFSVKSTATPQEKDQAYADYLTAQNALLSAQQSKQALQATLEQARASILTAAANQTTMQNNLNTSQPNPATKQAYTQNEIDLINSQLTSARESFTATETKYNQADSQIQAANASYQVSSLKYQATQDSTVTSPIDGKVANLSAIVGTAVTASTTTTSTSSSGVASGNPSSSTSGGSTVLVLGDFTSLYIKAPVSEVDVASVKSGEKATITLDAYPDKTYAGTVDSIDTIGTNSSGVVTYNAYIRFIDPPETIQPAMTASAVIQTARHDDVLYVPTTAVQTGSTGPTVRVMQQGKVVAVPVTTGLTSDTDTEIDSGLTEGETVVTSVVQPTTTSTSSTSPFSATGRGGFGGFGGGFGGAARGGGGARTGGGTVRGN